MRKLLTAVCIYLSFICYSQNPALDSLKARLSRAATSKEKVDLLGKFARASMSTNIPEADKYAERMTLEAELSRDRKLMVKALLTQGDRFSYFVFKKDYLQKSIGYYNQALELARENELDEEVAKAYLGLSDVHASIPELDKALNYTTQAVAIATAKNNDTLLVSVYNSLGAIYQLKKERIFALRNYLTALGIAEEAKNSSLLRTCYTNLSNFYAGIKDYDKAIDFARKSMQELPKMNMPNEKILHVVDLYTMGNLYVMKKNFETSTHYYDSVISLADSIKYGPLKMAGYEGLLQQYVQANQPRKALDFLNERSDLKQFVTQFGSGYMIDGSYGIIYSKLGMYDSAKYYFEKAAPVYETSGTVPYKFGFYYQYGDFYNKSGNTVKAIEFYEKAKGFADQSANLEYQEMVVKELDSLYVKAGDYKQSRFYNGLYHQYKDSMQKLGKEKDLMKMELADEQKRQERRAIEAAAALERKHTVQYTGIAIAIAIVFVLLVAMGIFRVSETTIRIMGFFAFILLFEFIILLADTRIHSWTHGEPLPVLGIKIILIAMLLPIHHKLEHKVVSYLASRRLIIPSGKSLWSKLRMRKVKTQT
jgi:tetratricopeptide (TPR) repeat protein